MRIVVDTNILFSALLNTNSNIANLLFGSNHSLEFYSCNYMRFEIEKHWEKLKKISKLSDHQLRDAQFYLFSQIKFINEETIPLGVWDKAAGLCNGVDLNDVDFVALTIYLNGYLWTGDKALYIGLKEKLFENVVNSSDLITLNGSS